MDKKLCMFLKIFDLYFGLKISAGLKPESSNDAYVRVSEAFPVANCLLFAKFGMACARRSIRRSLRWF